MTRRLLLPALVSLALLVLALAAAVPAAFAGGGCHDEGGQASMASEASSSVVKIDGCSFLPTVDRVAVGSTVTFLNSGTAPLDVSGPRGEWGSQLLEPGDSFRMLFSRPGVYAYSCSLHPGMAGVVVASFEAGPATGGEPSAPPASETPAEPDGGTPLATLAIGGAGLLVGAVGSMVVRRRRPDEA